MWAGDARHCGCSWHALPTGTCSKAANSGTRGKTQTLQELNAHGGQSIILGVVCGRFVSGGKQVQATRVVANETDVRKVLVQEVDVARRPTEVIVNAFLKTYPLVPLGDGLEGGRAVGSRVSGDGGEFDARPFTNFLKVARSVGLVVARGFSVLLGRAQGFLAAVAGDEVRSELRTRNVAARMDRELGQVARDVEGLKAAVQACGGEALSPADRGELVQDALGSLCTRRTGKRRANERSEGVESESGELTESDSDTSGEPPKPARRRGKDSGRKQLLCVLTCWRTRRGRLMRMRHPWSRCRGRLAAWTRCLGGMSLCQQGGMRYKWCVCSSRTSRSGRRHALRCQRTWRRWRSGRRTCTRRS